MYILKGTNNIKELIPYGSLAEQVFAIVPLDIEKNTRTSDFHKSDKIGLETLPESIPKGQRKNKYEMILGYFVRPRTKIQQS